MTAPANPFAFEGPAAAPAPAQPAPEQPAPEQPAAAPAAPPVPPQQAAAPAAPPAAVPAATPAGGPDPFDAPAPQAERPRVRDLYGRLLLIMPKLVETVPNRKSKEPGATQQRMTADVVVLDGGPLHYGGAPEKQPPVAHDKVAQVPMKIDALFISSTGIVSQCRIALQKRQAGQPGMVLGRLAVGEAKSPDQNAPYLLTVPSDEEKGIARAYLATVDPFA